MAMSNARTRSLWPGTGTTTLLAGMLLLLYQYCKYMVRHGGVSFFLAAVLQEFYLNITTPLRMMPIALAVLLRSVVPPDANIIG